MERSGNKHSVITVAICFLIAVIEGLDIQAAGIAAKGISEYFALDKSQLGIFFSAGILGLLPGALIGGRYADRIGRKKEHGQAEQQVRKDPTAQGDHVSLFPALPPSH